MPARFKEKIFKHFFESAELANLPRPRQMEYEESLKQLRDLKNVLRTAEKDAAKKADAKARKEEQEIAEKKIEQARKEEQEKAKQQLEDEQEKAKQQLEDEKEKAKQQTHQNIKEALKDGFTIKQVIKLFKVTEEEVLKIKNNQL
jgi:membrane protein involved in colicin uptake